MTFINPNGRRFRWHPFLVALIAVAILEGGALVVFYGQMVNMRHEIRNAEAEFKAIELSAIELRSELYTRLDPEALKTLATEKGFIADQKPIYLEIESDAVAGRL